MNRSCVTIKIPLIIPSPLEKGWDEAFSPKERGFDLG
jgi:hypothetical protein